MDNLAERSSQIKGKSKKSREWWEKDIMVFGGKCQAYLIDSSKSETPKQNYQCLQGNI